MITLLLAFQLLAPKIIQKPLPGRYHPRDTTINYIILHYDEGGSYSSARRTLIKRGNSYHYYIKKDGTIVQLVDDVNEAGHAGLSYFRGLVRINKYSIGICFENKPPNPYTIKQYTSAGWLIRKLQLKYPDSTSKVVVGHSDVAWPRWRKIDPGSRFNWELLHQKIEYYEQHPDTIKHTPRQPAPIRKNPPKSRINIASRY